MTTIISRLYDGAETAEAAAAALRAAGHDPETIGVVMSATEEPASALAARITAAGVGSVSAQRYAAVLAGQGPGALLVVRAPFTPFGRARSAMAIADGFAPRPVAGVNANQHVPVQPDPRISHPAIGRHAHVMTRDMPPFIARRRGKVSAAFGLPLLWHRSASGRVVSPGRPLSRLFWPLPLLSGRARS